MKCLVNWTLKHNGKRYEAGDTVELKDAEAALIGPCVTPQQPQKPQDPPQKKAEKDQSA